VFFSRGLWSCGLSVYPLELQRSVGTLGIHWNPSPPPESKGKHNQGSESTTRAAKAQPLLLLPSAFGLRPPASGLRLPAFGLRPPAFGLRPFGSRNCACRLQNRACGLQNRACRQVPYMTWPVRESWVLSIIQCSRKSDAKSSDALACGSAGRQVTNVLFQQCG